MSTSTQRAEEVLQRLRKRRTSPACYPCFKRKVRCEGGRPCQPCSQRGHPEICHDVDGPRKNRKVKLNAEVQALVPGSSAVDSNVVSFNASLSASQDAYSRGPPVEAVAKPITSSLEPQVGEHSAINFVRYRLGAAKAKIHDDVRDGIGLGNTNGRQPSVIPMGSATQNPDMTPKRHEVLQYYQAFRNTVMTLYPIVFDAAGLETKIFESLTLGADAHDPAHTALVLACLALGAQFAGDVADTRYDISIDFINRSHAYLQRANYVFRPSVEAVQTLLMIGIALQNIGQSEGAWTLLGLNHRLAQSLGLHIPGTSDQDSIRPALLWRAIIWQDSLLSLRYDRSPLSHYESNNSDSARKSAHDLSYFDAMGEVCSLAIDMLQSPHALRSDPEEIMRKVKVLESIVPRGCEHLRDHSGARTLQQRLEHSALQLHSSLLLAELCRPGFPSHETENDQRRWTIRTKGVSSLIATVEAYLGLCAFSNIPLRLWSMTQAAISCALVLALLDSQDSPESTTSLLRRLVEALKLDTSSHLLPMRHAIHSSLQGLCLMRVKAVGLLESILCKEHSSMSPPVRQEAAMDSNKGFVTDTSADAVNNSDALRDSASWPINLSLFDQAFADSVMDFDIGQEWSDITA